MKKKKVIITISALTLTFAGFLTTKANSNKFATATSIYFMLSGSPYSF